MNDQNTMPAIAEPAPARTPLFGEGFTPENVFEGHQGNFGGHADTSAKLAEIGEFERLVFDLDGPQFREGTDPLRLAEAILPEAEIRQTGLDAETGQGKYHALVHFERPAKNTKKLVWLYLNIQRALLADPGSSILAKARAVGSVKKKGDEEFVVAQVREGRPVGLAEIEERFSRGWESVLFKALTCGVLQAGDGAPLRPDPESGRGVCAVHGSGANPSQAAYDDAAQTFVCFGDCAADGRPQEHGLWDIVKARVLRPGVLDSYVAWFQDAAADGRRVVRLTPAMDIGEIAEAVGAALGESGEFFAMDGRILRLRVVEEPAFLDGPEKLGAAILDKVRILMRGQDGPKPYSISRNSLDMFLHSETFAGQLPEIREVAREGRFDEEYRPLPAGYHPNRLIFVVQPPAPPAEGIPTIRALLDVVPFATPGGPANLVGAALCRKLAHLYPGEHPGVRIRANKEGGYKTTCALLVAGAATTACLSLKADDVLIERDLSAHEQALPEVVVFDNVRGAVDSVTLERLITQREICFRVVGKRHLTPRRPNTMTVVFTDNGAAFTPDLSRRLITVETALYEDAEKRTSALGDPKRYIAENAEAIESELNGMVARWREAGCPLDAEVEHSMGAIVQAVGGILKAAGFMGFLADQGEQKSDSDAERRAMALLAEAAPDEWHTATEWHTILSDTEREREDDVSSALLAKGQGTPVSRLGRILKARVGETAKVRVQVADEISSPAAVHDNAAFKTVTCRLDFKQPKGVSRYCFSVVEGEAAHQSGKPTMPKAAPAAQPSAIRAPAKRPRKGQSSPPRPRLPIKTAATGERPDKPKTPTAVPASTADEEEAERILQEFGYAEKEGGR